MTAGQEDNELENTKNEIKACLTRPDWLLRLGHVMNVLFDAALSSLFVHYNGVLHHWAGHISFISSI